MVSIPQTKAFKAFFYSSFITNRTIAVPIGPWYAGAGRGVDFTDPSGKSQMASTSRTGSSECKIRTYGEIRHFQPQRYHYPCQDIT